MPQDNSLFHDFHVTSAGALVSAIKILGPNSIIFGLTPDIKAFRFLKFDAQFEKWIEPSISSLPDVTYSEEDRIFLVTAFDFIEVNHS